MPRPEGEGGVHRRGYQAFGTSASRRCNGLFLVILFFELIGPISPCIQIVILFNPLLATILTALCRVTIPCPDIGKRTRMRLYYLDSFTCVTGPIICTEGLGSSVNRTSSPGSIHQRVRRAALERTSLCLPLADVSITPTISPLVGRPLLLERSSSSC